jgi:putative flippase GtrA
LISHFASTQFLAFLLTGGLAAIANFTSRIFYNQFWDFSTAIVLAYITGMFCAFILNKYFVFTNSQQVLHKSILLFTLINFLGIMQTWIVSMGLDLYILPILNIHHHKKDIAHGIGILVPVFTSFLGHKFYSFR